MHSVQVPVRVCGGVGGEWASVCMWGGVWGTGPVGGGRAAWVYIENGPARQGLVLCKYFK